MWWPRCVKISNHERMVFFALRSSEDPTAYTTLDVQCHVRAADLVFFLTLSSGIHSPELTPSPECYSHPT